MAAADVEEEEVKGTGKIKIIIMYKKHNIQKQIRMKFILGLLK